jgi:uncharacterized protein
MDARSIRNFYDALYGEVQFSESIAALAATPALQRLRFVRLSNIDSLAMPGIANISRYEHALGAAHLASQLSFTRRLPQDEATVLQAAALLHDSAIAPFGHLVEEALAYVGVSFDHETKWLRLLESPEGAELGGMEAQVFCGRVSGLRRWGVTTFGTYARERLLEIVELVSGRGKWGSCIAGAIDVDNLDNLVRIAFHMGLSVDRQLPLRVARAAVSFDQDGPIFATTVVEDVEAWSRLRRTVYTRLMLAPSDLCMKIMLLYAVVLAFRHGDLEPHEFVWAMTDDSLVERLTSSGDPRVKQTAAAWMTNELWPLAEPTWFRGKTPGYAQVADFADHLSGSLGRECFAYRIADKRVRPISLKLESGKAVSFGERSEHWLLGVASRVQRPFSQAENRTMVASAESYFGVIRVPGSQLGDPAVTSLLGNA